jgi:4-alpha-glucanotransferase
VNTGRSSGVLLHITSLPGRFGIGDLGPESRTFVDFLQQAKQKLWCVLPLAPAGEENSPYRSPSAFAGNSMFVSPELLQEQGYVSKKDLRFEPRGSASKVDFPSVRAFKEQLLQKAFLQFSATKDYSVFTRKNSWWLDRYALFMALKEANNGVPWPRFSSAVQPDPEAIRFHKFVQYEVFRQWHLLRAYCHARDVSIMGDMPFYVEHDSADVWSSPELFDLLKNGEPATVGGVPPDYFSEDGQLWGTPTYNWGNLRKTGFKWWLDRFGAAFETVDLLRLDHFRGFEAYWSVPANERTARNGRWKRGPGARLFETVQKRLGALAFVAENLGVITPEVEELLRRFHFPGMAVLQFGFDEEGAHRTNNYIRDLVCFTGTHDNDTTRGWWENLLKSARTNLSARATVDRIKSFLQTNGREIHWSCIQAILTSVANVAVMPMQDILGLGSEARMNLPGEAKGNWEWRLTGNQLERADVERLRDLTIVSGRACSGAAQE